VVSHGIMIGNYVKRKKKVILDEKMGKVPGSIGRMLVF
jgi:hypothetical protein